MQKKLLTIFFLISLCFQIAKTQQESQYTQFIQNQQAFNPAYAGIKKSPEIYALYRQQWAGYTGAPQNQILGFNTSFLSERTGFGLLFSRKSLGITRTWAAKMSYAYEFHLGEKSALRFGLEGNMKQLQLDFRDQGVIPLEDNDPVIFEGRLSTQYYLNWGSGLYFLHPNFYLGCSIPNILPQQISWRNRTGSPETAQESRHFYLIAGFSTPINEKLRWRSTLLGKYVKNAPPDLDINCSLTFKENITGGLAYRTGGFGQGESIDLLLFYSIKKLDLGMAYDILLSQLTNFSSGSFEVFCRYHLEKDKPLSSNTNYNHFF